MSDKSFYWYYYLVFFGMRFSYKNPKGFNAKIQWLKTYYRDNRMIKLADKYEARKYVAEKIGAEFLVPVIDVYTKKDEINWVSLPDCFVMKATHASGWNIVCSSKSDENPKKVLRKINRWLNSNFYYINREWQYKDIRPRIICEEHLGKGGIENLNEVKVFCYYGKPHFVVAYPYKNALRTIYNTNWEIIDGETAFKKGAPINKPENLSLILQLASKLSGDFPFVRVDFIVKNGKIYFGEMSFTPARGFLMFNPKSLDILFGEPLKIPI